MPTTSAPERPYSLVSIAPTAHALAMSGNTELLTKVEALQNLLVSAATGGTEDNTEYRRLRDELLAEPTLIDLLPRFLHTCRDLNQFWGFIKHKYGTYKERRNYLWEEFRPALESLERGSAVPGDEMISDALSQYDAEHVHRVWTRALERRTDDPEGAITSARTLLETVCKHILDESGSSYDETDDLPKLYRATAQQLKLAPNQHSEQIFKQILGGCQSVVSGLGAVRNKLSDAHGQGKKPVRPAPRHAELAVNLAGTVAVFLVATWTAQKAGLT
ncbi:hypothetical protein BH23GEM5_BH23GEM5_24890 [soil metagenome]